MTGRTHQSGLRFVFIRGPDGSLGTDRLHAGREAVVGRPDPASTAEDPDISLGSDMRVSRRHARVWSRGPACFLEDLGSKRGTLVGGRQVKGAGPTEFPPGTPVRTGDTEWTVIPAEWLYVNHQGVVVFGPVAATTCYAAYHCGVPIVAELTAWNAGSTASHRFEVELALGRFGGRCAVTVPELAPNERRSLGTPLLPLSGAALRAHREPVTTTLHVRVAGKSAGEGRRELNVLGFWDWPYEKPARRLLAAFTCPWHPLVERVVSEAQERLAATTHWRTFADLLCSSGRDAERVVLGTLYDCLRNSRRIRYARPLTRQGGPVLPSYQTVRSPERIFHASPDTQAGAGTCLDLSLLVAGCLENTGLWPVIVLLEDDATGRPWHALPGCWLAAAPAGRPVVTDGQLLRTMVAAGDLLLVESLGLSDGAGPPRGNLPFALAVESAAEQLMSSTSASAVAIGALRPPRGTITPMHAPFEPIVERAHQEALRFAAAAARPAETACLLLGLLKARGQVVEQLADGLGLDVAEICERLRARLQRHEGQWAPAPTRNFLDCLNLAQELASREGSMSVREQDLLWALLTKVLDSTALQDAFNEAGLDVAAATCTLEQLHPRPNGAWLRTEDLLRRDRPHDARQ